MKKKKACLLAVLTLTMAGCIFVQNESDLHGTYVAAFPFGTTKVALLPDHTLVQDVELFENRKKLHSVGRWSFNAEDSQVDFYSAYTISDGYGKLGARYDTLDSASIPVARHLISRRIYLECDEYHAYERVK